MDDNACESGRVTGGELGSACLQAGTQEYSCVNFSISLIVLCPRARYAWKTDLWQHSESGDAGTEPADVVISAFFQKHPHQGGAKGEEYETVSAGTYHHTTSDEPVVGTALDAFLQGDWDRVCVATQRDGRQLAVVLRRHSHCRGRQHPWRSDPGRRFRAASGYDAQRSH